MPPQGGSPTFGFRAAARAINLLAVQEARDSVGNSSSEGREAVGVRVTPSPAPGVSGARREWSLVLETALELGVLVVLGSIVLLAWVHLAYARPLADDYSVAVLGRELGAAG